MAFSSVVSCRRAARLSATVIRTKNEDIGSVGIGVVCSGAVFIAARRFFDGSCGSHQSNTFGRSDLRCGNQDRTHQHLAAANVGVGWAGRRVHRGIPLSRAAARRRREPPGIVPSFVRTAGLSGHHHSFRPWGRLSSLWRPRFGHHRAALRVIRHVTALSGGSFCAGSFERPYNTRLHQTAPCEHFSFSPW